MSPRPYSRLTLISLSLLLLAACKKEHPNAGGTGTGANVYVLGVLDDTVVCWKNGVATDIYSQSFSDYSFSSSSLAASGANVYIAGSEINYAGGPDPSFTPTFWLNGVANPLPDSSGNAYTEAVAVSDGDVYVGGVTQYFEDTSHVPYTTDSASYPKTGSVATLWKNGLPVSLQDVSFVGLVDSGQYATRVCNDYVNSVFLSGTDVYVSGGSFFSNHHAAYWKNGSLVDLTGNLSYTAANGGSGFPNTSSIFVSGSDVYVAGYQSTSFVFSVAIYWKNGSPVFLSTDSADGSQALSIVVSGGDVYVAGWQNVGAYSRAMLWKNGVATALTGGSTASVANAVYISGNDVYVAGYTWMLNGHQIATYWKNGTAVQLSDGASNAVANSIFVQ